MIGAKKTQSQCVQYELEISIDAECPQVWTAITEETNSWWLPDFHMVDPNSQVTFDTRAGGGLIERFAGGGSLLWYTVHWIRPAEFTVYLVGQLAPDWGGPATTHLKLSVEPCEAGGCVLRVSDALHGDVDDATADSLHSGWKQLFHDGLKAFVEQDMPRSG